MMWHLRAALFLLFFTHLNCYTADISIGMEQSTKVISADHLVSGAGSDLITPICLSLLNVSITNTKNKSWKIYVRLDPSCTIPNTRIQVTRITNGSGKCIEGGSGPVSVEAANILVCWGMGDNTGISIICQLKDITLRATPPGGYRPTLIFEIADE